jgi:DNA-binding MarR family transcriptional regulator
MMTVAPKTASPVVDLAPRLRAAVTRLNRRLRTTSLDGISPARASALATIEKLGAPALNELAAAEQVRPPSMTRLVDSLERDGLVARRVDEVDRRCQRVSLTASGRRALTTIRMRKTAFLEERLSELSVQDLDAIGRALSILERLSEDT